MELKLCTFYISALHGNEESVSGSGCIIPGKGVLSTHSVGDWVGPRLGLYMWLQGYILVSLYLLGTYSW